LFDWTASIPEGLKDEINLQIEFESPYEISMSGIRDRVSVKITDERFFTDPENGETLDKLSAIKSLPGQMPYECSTCDFMLEAGEVAETSVAAAVGASIAAGIVTGMAINLVYGLVNMI
jgi:hypothetical protein